MFEGVNATFKCCIFFSLLQSLRINKSMAISWSFVLYFEFIQIFLSIFETFWLFLRSNCRICPWNYSNFPFWILYPPPRWCCCCLSVSIICHRNVHSFTISHTEWKLVHCRFSAFASDRTVLIAHSKWFLYSPDELSSADVAKYAVLIIIKMKLSLRVFFLRKQWRNHSFLKNYSFVFILGSCMKTTKKLDICRGPYNFADWSIFFSATFK